MSTRTILIAVFASALCVPLVVLALLRFDESPSIHSAPTRLPITARRVPVDNKVLPAHVETEHSSQPAVEHQVLPTEMARALEDAGMGQHPPEQVLESEHTFTAENVDPRWAPGMEARIYNEMAQIPGSNLLTVQVQCKTSVCRLEVTQQVSPQDVDFGAAVASFYDELFRRLGYASHPVLFAVDGAGIATSLDYLPRRDPAGTAPVD